MDVDSATRAIGVADRRDPDVAIQAAPYDNRGASISKSHWIGLVLAVLAAFGMWYYVGRVLIPYQQGERVQAGSPHGNFSDFCPYWLGTRELLVYGRSPYLSPELSIEDQKCYLGAVIDPHLVTPDFAYPPYVVFIVAPTLAFSFPTARIVVAIILVLLTTASVLLWTRAFHLRASFITIATIIAALMGTFPVVQGLVLQQLTMLVAGLLALSAAALAGGELALAGALLALATFKPHLALPVVAWLLLWTIADWRKRRNFVFGFAAVMAVLLVGAEIVLPGWPARWWEVLHAYSASEKSQPLLSVILGHYVGILSCCVLLVVTTLVCWRSRKDTAGSPRFSCAFALLLTTNVLTTPMWHTYDQVLLLPAAIWLIFNWKRGLVFHAAARLIYALAAVIISWGSIAAVGLTLVSLVSHTTALKLHVAPVVTVVLVPLAMLFALALPALTPQKSSC